MSENVPRVILAGDSISFGCGLNVKKLLSGIFEIRNLPENGGTSDNLLVHLDEWIIKQEFYLAHLNCGLHDLAIDAENNTNRVSPKKYEENIEEIIYRLKKETSTFLIWATTTPVIYDRHHLMKNFDRLENDVRIYNRIAVRIMRKHGVLVNDLYSIVEDAGREICISGDGVHFTWFDYDLLAKTIAVFQLRYKKKWI